MSDINYIIGKAYRIIVVTENKEIEALLTHMNDEIIQFHYFDSDYEEVQPFWINRKQLDKGYFIIEKLV